MCPGGTGGEREEVRNHRGIIANPNCSTIIMVLALKPIFDRAGIKRCGFHLPSRVRCGGKAMDELRMQTEDYLAGREMAANILLWRAHRGIIPSLST